MRTLSPGVRHEFLSVLHPTANLRRGAVADHPDRWCHLAVPIADQRISRGGAADGRGPCQLPGCEPQSHRRNRRVPAGTGHYGRRGHALHVVPGDRRWQADPDHYVCARNRSGQRPGAGAEPRHAHPADAADRSAAPRRYGGQGLPGPNHGGAPDLAGRTLRHALSVQLCGAQRQGRAGAAGRDW